MEESLIAATRDAIYGWAVERLVRQQSAAGQPSYLYVFDHCYDAAWVRKLCAFHASELPLDRKSVVSGKSVSVRVDLGGRRIHKKKKKHTNPITDTTHTIS